MLQEQHKYVKYKLRQLRIRTLYVTCCQLSQVQSEELKLGIRWIWVGNSTCRF